MEDDMDGKFDCDMDKFTETDRAYLRQLTSMEKEEVVSVLPVADGLELVGVHHQNECWTLMGNPNFPDGLTFDVREIKTAMAEPDSRVTVVRLPLTEWLYQRT